MLTPTYLTPLLQVFDMPRSVAFYRDVLGFRVVSTSEPADSYTWCMLQHGEATLMLNTLYDEGEQPASPDQARAVVHADTILYLGCANADDAYDHLRGAGWPAEEPINTHYGMRQVYTKDPDGYALCFQHPVG